MNNMTERALLTDLAKLKGAHNNLVNKTQEDLTTLTNAVRQLATALTGFEQRLAAIEQRLAPRAAPRAQPQQVQQTPSPAQQPAAQVVTFPATPAMPDTSAWPVDDEEDADLVE